MTENEAKALIGIIYTTVNDIYYPISERTYSPGYEEEQRKFDEAVDIGYEAFIGIMKEIEEELEE